MIWSWIDRYKQTGLFCFYSAAGDIVRDVKKQLRRYKHPHYVIYLEASETAAFVLSNMLHKAEGHVLFDLRGFLFTVNTWF